MGFCQCLIQGQKNTFQNHRGSGKALLLVRFSQSGDAWNEDDMSVKVDGERKLIQERLVLCNLSKTSKGSTQISKSDSQNLLNCDKTVCIKY